MFWFLLSLTLLLFLGPLLAIGGKQLLGAKGRRSLGVAVRNLWLHKMRSFLSVLGIIIGTTAVITLMAIGEGSMRDALEDIMKQGATNIIVVSIKPPDDGSSTRRAWVAKYGLTDDDYRRFQTTIPTLVADLPIRAFDSEIRPSMMGSRMYNGRVVATTPRYALVHKLDDKIAAGRFLSASDENPLPANVVVLGSEAAAFLFPGEDPIGDSIFLQTGWRSTRAFQVVGVLKDRMPSTAKGEIEKYNSDVYIPLISSRQLLGEQTQQRKSGAFIREHVLYTQITLTVSDEGETEEVRDRVRQTADIIRNQLETYHDINRKDWDIRIPLDKLEDAERTRTRYRIYLAFVAGISLLVGGIGIMNIMLATVTERTREIGIRRALGAKRSDITLQFLVEAVVQTTLGGLVGVGLGFALIYLIPPVFAFFGLHVPTTVHEQSVIIAFLVSVAVGVLFGLYPAYRAACLDPIEALRHE